MTVVHTYFYIAVDTQRGCHTLKKKGDTASGPVGAAHATEGLNINYMFICAVTV